MSYRSGFFLLVGAVLSVLPAPASAAIFATFTASSGNLAAEMTLEQSGGNLIVTLTNTSTSDVLVPADVLTAVFFDFGQTLTPVSAVLNTGSSVFYDAQGQPAGGVVGGEWEYLTGLSGAPGGATSGISSSGFALFGSPNFPGADLETPAAVDGLQYGILSAGDNTGTGNGGITGSGGLIKNSVVFTLSGVSGTLSASDFTNVSFQYGTALTEPNITPPEEGPLLPEPTSIVAWLLSAGGLGLILRRRRNKAAA